MVQVSCFASEAHAHGALWLMVPTTIMLPDMPPCIPFQKVCSHQISSQNLQRLQLKSSDVQGRSQNNSYKRLQRCSPIFSEVEKLQMHYKHLENMVP